MLEFLGILDSPPRRFSGGFLGDAVVRKELLASELARLHAFEHDTSSAASAVVRVQLEARFVMSIDETLT